ncbi:hypothetical protein U8335_04090 [Roseiconus lacunae]|uniref:hypothetical protein n=1 Tax=Roseiconus lacunae TaxID=2605694 RepID=UPI003093DEFA|nr:hypothetical protein U8335_04090 [Stieleria sp. HD01]
MARERIRPGRTQTLAYSFFRDAERAIAATKRLTPGGVNAFPLGSFDNASSLIGRGKNTTDKPIRRYAIMALGEMVLDSAAAMDEPLWEINEPTGNPLETPVVVIESSPAAGANTGAVRFVLAGQVPALVDHTVGDDHVRIGPAPGAATQHAEQPSTDQPTRIEILHAPANGDLCLVNLGPPSQGWIFKTRSGGIPAMTGTTPGSAMCDAYYIDDAGDLVELRDADDNQVAKMIYTIAPAATDGATWILTGAYAEKNVIVTEFCEGAE